MGGYRREYDPRPVLAALRAGTDVAGNWSELWEELHHQGNVGEASYAAVIVLADWATDTAPIDWNLFALATTVEMARQTVENPPIPDLLAGEYAAAWAKLFSAALALLPGATDETLISASLAVVAVHKGQASLARMACLSESERKDMLDEVGWG